jgi:hypothetical protein
MLAGPESKNQIRIRHYRRSQINDRVGSGPGINDKARSGSEINDETGPGSEILKKAEYGPEKNRSRYTTQKKRKTRTEQTQEKMEGRRVKNKKRCTLGDPHPTTPKSEQMKYSYRTKILCQSKGIKLSEATRRNLQNIFQRRMQGNKEGEK